MSNVANSDVQNAHASFQNALVNLAFKHLNLNYIPLGGINISNVKNYLNSDLVLAVGGSWLAPKHLIKSKKWQAISSNCKEINRLIL